MKYRVPDDNNDMPMPNERKWEGDNLGEIRIVVKKCELPLVPARKDHVALYDTNSVDVYSENTPKPGFDFPQTLDASDCVAMPYHKDYRAPVHGKTGRFDNRWDVVCEALCKNKFSKSEDVLNAMGKYCYYLKRKNDTVLYKFLNIKNEDLQRKFVQKLIPDIVNIMLAMKDELPNSIPLLRKGQELSVSLSQWQIACILANAFFCTFPKQKYYKSFPSINFNELLFNTSRQNSYIEKLNCIFAYFQRVVESKPKGIVTFHRKCIDAIDWSQSTECLAKFHVTYEGSIEDDGENMLRVDFANKMVGGGVLNSGCVQEEILFLIYPELIASRLFTEELNPNEALVISGVERFNYYEGYSSSFKWKTPPKDKEIDNTEYDGSGRRCCSFVAIDASPYYDANSQYYIENIERELNKAYAGFSIVPGTTGRPLPIATGNWGCGVFNGNVMLKSLIQMMAAALAGRDLVYFTFGDKKLMKILAEMNKLLRDKSATVGELFKVLELYNQKKLWKLDKPFNKSFIALFFECREGESGNEPPTYARVTQTYARVTGGDKGKGHVSYIN